jgi:hypothetical protein
VTLPARGHCSGSEFNLKLGVEVVVASVAVGHGDLKGPFVGCATAHHDESEPDPG